MAIPKRIIYCWFGHNPKSEWMENCIASWKRVMPDYEILEINEDNFDINSIKYVKDAYENKAWGFVADPIRLWALYEYGGIYFDTDIEVFNRFDDLLDNEMFMGFEQPHYLSTATIGATKHNPIIKELLDAYDNETFAVREHWQDYKTSPMVMTDVLEKYFDRDKMEYQKCDGITIYPKNYFVRSEKENEEIYCKHHMFGCWVK